MMPITSHAVAVVNSVESLGFVARAKRESLGLGLREAAPAAGVGTRFLSEFERGKPTAEIGKVLAALHAIGLDLAVVPSTQTEVSNETPYSQRLKTEFPYDWSNSRMSSALFIRKVLQAHRFNDMLKVVGHFGFDQVSRELATLGDPAKIEKAADILARIYKGMLLARAQDAAS